MTRHEQSTTPEDLSQQFIDYVTTHSDIPRKKKATDVIREASWKLSAPAPRLGDTVLFGEYTMEPYQGHTDDEHAYDIGLFTSNDQGVYFIHEPWNIQRPFSYRGTGIGGTRAIGENEIMDLLTQLQEHEAAGQLTKIVPEGDSSH